MHTRLPFDRSVREQFESLVTSRGTDVPSRIRMVLRSRDSKRDCGLPAFAPVRAHATTETYETITKSDFSPPRGDQLHARGPKKCRGLARARARQYFVAAKSLLRFDLWTVPAVSSIRTIARSVGGKARNVAITCSPRKTQQITRNLCLHTEDFNNVTFACSTYSHKRYIIFPTFSLSLSLSVNMYSTGK